MLNHDNEEYIFKRGALQGKIADKDGVSEALTELAQFYQQCGVHRRDAQRVVQNLRTSFESGKAHNQAKRGERIKKLLADVQSLSQDVEFDE